MTQWRHHKFTNTPVLSVVAFQRQTVPPRRILGSHIPEREANEVINLFVPVIGSWTRATEVRHTLFAIPTCG